MKTLKLALLYAFSFPAIGAFAILLSPLVGLYWLGVLVKSKRLQTFAQNTTQAAIGPFIDFIGRLEIRLKGE